MKCLTVKQPWAWAIFDAGKDVENRTWRTWYRGPLLIHAGKRCDVSAPALLLEQENAAPRQYGLIIGVVDLVGWANRYPSRWAVAGQYHWNLANPRRLLNPIPWRGQMGLFEVPDAVVSEIRTAEVKSNG